MLMCFSRPPQLVFPKPLSLLYNHNFLFHHHESNIYIYVWCLCHVTMSHCQYFWLSGCVSILTNVWCQHTCNMQQSAFIFIRFLESWWLYWMLGCRFWRNSGQNHWIVVSVSVILGLKLRNLLNVNSCFFQCFSLYVRERPFHATPSLWSMPRPMGEGLSIAFWALQLSEKSFQRS